MEDFCRPVIQDEYYVVRQPAIEANNFELKLSLITMVQQHQFTEHPNEDPNEHIGRFMRMAKTIKLNGLCDALFPGCPLTTRQPVEYSWMSGNPTPLTKIGQSLICTGSSTQIQNLSQLQS